MLNTVLIVDDEPDLLDLLELTLTRMGLDVGRATNVAEARARLTVRGFGLCLTDMRLPDGTGLEVVRLVAELRPETPVAVITAHGSAENAVAAMKAGAFDYLAKPVALDQLRALVKSALNVREPARAGADQGSTGQGLTGTSPAMEQVRARIAKVARTHAPVYIHGESGTGKELAARLVHAQGPRRDKPFVAVNCGAIPETLMESEFFGYRKGAFTGAEHDREGFFQAASGGTLFLDEVADLPLPMQVKLLRAIQEKRVRRVGSTQEEPADVRLICATHQDLAERVAQGGFRQDLYYRLNVIDLHMPALRERPEDIPGLARALLGRLAAASGRAEPRLDASAEAALMAYGFPGNVRELENLLERALALCEGQVLNAGDLDLAPARSEFAAESGAAAPLPDHLDRIERELIQDALDKTRHNKTAAARRLGITFRSLRYRMERLGME
jgi:two-component system response regulator PilR (NtrC family)